MKRNTTWIWSGIFLIALVSGAAWAYNFVLGETEEASAPISAIPLEVTTSPAIEVEQPTEPGSASEEEALPTAAPEEEAATTPIPVEEVTPPTEVPTEVPAEEPAATGEPRVFAISQAASQARFTIYEELRGQPTDVVGITDQVAGEIALDLDDLGATQVGILQVNARTLVTDSDRRNQAIRNFILNTDDYEFITFIPSGVEGLSGAATPGESFQFQIPGELTIRDRTNPVTLSVTARMVTEEEVRGTATTVVLRDDYGLTIPSVPAVANVGEEVTIEIEFTLLPRES